MGFSTEASNRMTHDTNLNVPLILAFSPDCGGEGKPRLVLANPICPLSTALGGEGQGEGDAYYSHEPK
jgi:hypothetical protein